MSFDDRKIMKPIRL